MVFVGSFFPRIVLLSRSSANLSRPISTVLTSVADLKVIFSFPAERSVFDSLALAMLISTGMNLNPTQERKENITTNPTRTTIGLAIQFDGNPSAFMMKAPV
jgi:hypothetical protein